MKWDGSNSIERRHSQESARQDTCSCGGTLDDVDFCRTEGIEATCEDCPNFGVLKTCEGIVVKKVCRDCGAMYETE
jgi:hypothetical protein